MKGADCPAARVSGSEIPDSTNSALFRLAELTVTDAPVAFKLPLSDELDPTTALPNAKAAGETASWPAAAPVPDSTILSVGFDPFDTIARLPLAAPDPVGVNVVVNVTL